MSNRIGWLSGGVSSFVANYLAKPDRLIYINVRNQHPDTLRFVADCSEILKKPVEIIGSFEYEQSVDKVIEKRRYINGVAGASCTTQLKKKVRQDWERKNATPDMVYIWGFDVSEARRAERTRQNSEFACEFPLIEHRLSKENCHALAAELGLRLPKMYELGYRNNNCIGCVKGGKGYWNKIRKDFPDVFAKRARQERELGHSCINGCFLDELKPNQGRIEDEIMPACSFDCVDMLT